MVSLEELLEEAVKNALEELQTAEKAHLEAAAEVKHAKKQFARLSAAQKALNAENLEETPQKVEKTEEAAKKPENHRPNDPLAHIPCSGCGAKGSLIQTAKQAPSGAVMQMTVCTKCNNQLF